MKNFALATAVALTVISAPAAAQGQEAPRRTRVVVGPAITPAYPGADRYAIRPYFDLSFARGDTPFEFEAPDESTGIALYEDQTISVGPVLGFEGRRRARDAGGLDKINWGIELGGYVHLNLAPSFRLTGELRRGVNGHAGIIGVVGADYVARDGDSWLFSVGPRVTLANARYNDTYFGVSPTESARTGIAAYRPGGGVQSYGATTSALKQLNDRWSLFGYAKYDRLVGDAADSPVVRGFGSRDQFNAGIGLGYTFGRGVR